MRFVRPLAAIALSAVLFGLAFPPVSARELAFVCLVPLFLTLRGRETRPAACLAGLWAVGAALTITTELPHSIESFFLQPAWVAWSISIAIIAVTASLFYMVFAAAYCALEKRFVLTLPLLAAAAWTAVEFGRGRLFTVSSLFIGNPWGLLGYTRDSADSLAQIAAVTGVYGISFAIVAANVGIAMLAAGLLEQPRSLRRPLAALAVGLAPAALALVYGTLVLRAAPAPGTGAGFVQIAAIQGDVALGSRWRSEYYGANLDIYADLTSQALSQGDPAIVFWPEGALTFFVESEPLYRRAIARVIAEDDVELVAGGPSVGREEGEAYHNSIFHMTPGESDLELRARYDKQYLVPFSEYYPFAAFARFVNRRFDGARVFVPGGQSVPFATRAGRAGIIVCNEAMLPEVAVQRANDGASYLLSPSNDSWLRDPDFAARMFALVSLRAVEQRRFLVRVSTSGPSAVIDPWGRVLVRTKTADRQILLGRIQPRSELSIYGRVGDLFAVLCTLATAVAWLRARGSQPAGAEGAQTR